MQGMAIADIRADIQCHLEWDIGGFEGKLANQKHEYNIMDGGVQDLFVLGRRSRTSYLSS